MPLRVLVLEPFGDGSHAAFYNGWQELSQHSWTVLQLPARHWKWRSRHASLTLATRCLELVQSGAEFDVVLCSDMLNLPEWRGMLKRSACSLQTLPTVAYFHENQFSYPLNEGETHDYHYGYSNILTACAADSLWFNSEFHRCEFAESARSWLRRLPDYQHRDIFDAAISNSQVCPPGIGVEPSDVLRYPRNHLSASKGPTIGWVARWEHDKRPDRFAKAIQRLVADSIPFRLILLGQQFKRRPASLVELCQVAQERIQHVGFVPSREEYLHWLSQIDIVVSTADHEFFGIGIVEAMALGARPLLPQTLSYPEVLDLKRHPERNRYFYSSDADGLYNTLRQTLTLPFDSHKIDIALQSRALEFSWSRLSAIYDQYLLDLVERCK